MFKSKRTVAKSNLLKKYVKQFWEVKSDESTDFSKLLLPVTFNDIILYISKPITYNFENEVRVENYPYIQGPRSKSIYLSQPGNIHIIGVTFHMFLSLPFSPVPLRELKDNILHLNDKLKIRKIKTLDSAQDRIEDGLLEYLNKENVPSDIELELLVGLLNSKTTIAEYCESFGTNIKRVERLYIKHTGMTPKQFLKIYRMQITNNKIINNELNSLTDLSYDMGYFDQTHMGKDFDSVHSKKPKDFLNDDFTIKSILKKNS